MYVAQGVSLENFADSKNVAALFSQNLLESERGHAREGVGKGERRGRGAFLCLANLLLCVREGSIAFLSCSCFDFDF